MQREVVHHIYQLLNCWESFCSYFCNTCGILCHKKINFMLPSGSPRYKGLLCASEDWWHTVVIWGKAIPSPFCRFISILTYHSWFQVHHDSPWHVLPSGCFIEKCGERVIRAEFIWQVLEGAIRLNAMLQAEELPARISYLHSSLANVHRDALTLRGERKGRVRKKCTLALLIPGGCIFPVYCFAKQLVSCHCQLFIWLFSPTATVRLHMPDTETVLLKIEISVLYYKTVRKNISIAQTPPFFLDWPCWGTHPSLVYFYSWLEPDTAMWHPSPLCNPRQVMSVDPSTLW